MSSTSLALYRTLVPGHALVKDATVDVWLELAASRHTAARFGAQYEAAMIWWAAAHLEVQRLAGQVGTASKGGACAPATADASASKGPAATVAEPYWTWYRDIRDSRAAGVPQRIST